jgi:hypothetical protein
MHNVPALHATNIGIQMAARNVRIATVWQNKGLFANYSIAFYFSLNTFRVENKPMSAQQLYGRIAFVLD